MTSRVQLIGSRPRSVFGRGVAKLQKTRQLEPVDSRCAVLIANPIPSADEMPAELYERALHTALSEAETQRIRGRAVTPFLLDRMRRVTGGESVRANVALLRHNAQVAAALAVAGV